VREIPGTRQLEIGLGQDPLKPGEGSYPNWLLKPLKQYHIFMANDAEVGLMAGRSKLIDLSAGELLLPGVSLALDCCFYQP